MGAPNFASPSNASKYFVVMTGSDEKFKECPECGEKHYEYTYGDLNKVIQCENDCEDVELTEGSEYRYPESYEWDDFKENIGTEFHEIEGGDSAEGWLDSSNSYGIQQIGEVQREKYYGDIYVRIIVKAVMQSAYYEGATLDYLVYLEVDGDDYEIATGSRYDDDLEESMRTSFLDYSYSELNVGIKTILVKKAVTWAEREIEAIGEEIEKIYEQYSAHKLGCVGVFSNGEAVYEKVN